MSTKSQILFLSHGGGPLPLLGDERHKEMVNCLQRIVSMLRKPSAIIVVSAHWEEKNLAITSGANPPIIFDYSGFPDESYSITYPCPGEPLLAEQVRRRFELAGIPANLNDQRGFDHGLFIPLKFMYPDADIPCIQISLLDNLDPGEHINIGRTLQGLEYDNLLIIGSGFSFHNISAFLSPDTNESKTLNESFETWLLHTCKAKSLTEDEREQRLIHWENAPGARFCHPREEHLLPLHVCYGIANTACTESFELRILNKKSSMYLWL